MRVLVAGWFSFEGMGATAGDLLCRDLLCRWLRTAGCACDVATAAPFSEGVAWDEVDPAEYTHVIFVCGPFGNGWPVTDLLDRFGHCRLIGLNLTMLDRLENWNPFELLLERDSDVTVRPDMSFLTEARRVPIVGVILAHQQKEYGARGRHHLADAAIDRLLAARQAAAVPIDTRLDENATGLRTPAEVESLIARMDAVVTTRLHGAVLALKNGVPAVVIDPIAGGAKVRRQMQVIDWPVCCVVDDLDDRALQAALEYCLSVEARERARWCRERARRLLSELKPRLMTALASLPERIEV